MHLECCREHGLQPGGGTPIARIRNVFSKNLRRHFSGRGAIARAEEATGVSRVQFSRYLNGTIPHEANLVAIANYLGIEEHELFQAPHEIELPLHGDTKALAFHAGGISRPGDRMLVLYFEVPKSDVFVVKAVIKVSEHPEGPRFSRHTGFDVEGAAAGSRLVHDHTGVVVRVGSVEYYVGRRVEKPHEPSLLYLIGVGSGGDVYEGGALVMSPSGPAYLRIVARSLSRSATHAEIEAELGAVRKPATGRDARMIQLLDQSLPIDLPVG